MSNKRNNFYKKNWYYKKSNKNRGKKDDSTAIKTSINQLSSSKENSDHLSIYSKQRNLDIPYYGWQLFFHDEDYKDNSDTVKKVQAIERFTERHQDVLSLTLTNLEDDIAFNIDIHELYNDNIFLSDWIGFKNDIYENPIYTLNCIKLAIHQKILETIPQENRKSIIKSIHSLPTVRLKILNYQSVICLKDLKVNCYGKLISTRGCVIRVGRTKQLAQWIVFTCSKCNIKKIAKQPQGIYTVPKKCDVCGVVRFHPVLDSPYVKSIPFQMIRIQELLNDEQENKGRMPRTLDVELTDDLVNTCLPGDDINLIGVIKVQGVDDGTAKTNNANSFSLYMEAVTIINNKHRRQNKNVMDSEMSLKDYLAIKEVYNEPNLFALLVHSLCPSIYGHEMIKAGLILSLFGGNVKHSDLRDDIHVLIVGDPGLGKSQMLQACARVAVKGVYICGNTSTSSGLTVTLTKESGFNDFALEPGALVLADRGSCCIDEFDKMCTQHQALLEAMEQQSVSVAKSGVVCSLPARTSILAAANPIGGRYDRSKTMKENLNISQPLLSRFDLVFLLLDQPNEQLDSLLCKHVMTVHRNMNNFNTSKKTVSELYTGFSPTKKCSLKEKLTTSSGENFDIIPQSILRKYISYARQYVKPKLSIEAAAILQEFYLELRSKNNGFGGIPIYNRQLEAMIRLTEARAKLELRTETTESDALDVIEILRYTMLKTMDNDVIPKLAGSTSGKSTEKKIRVFIQLMKNEVKVDKEKTFSITELNKIASKGGIVLDDFSRFILKLNDEGILLNSGRNLYRFIAS